jgi:comEA protein
MKMKNFVLILPVLFVLGVVLFPVTGLAVDEKAVQPMMKSGSDKALGSEASGAPSGVTNINTASVEELAKLPGIGPKIAEEIVKFRKEHGDFKSTRDIINVKGVGEKKSEAIQDKITVGQAESPTGAAKEGVEKAVKGKAVKEMSQ